MKLALRAWPARVRGMEFLDDPHLDPEIATRSLVDIARSNQLFGGTRAVLAELVPVFAGCGGRTLTLLDVGTGAGDIPERARAAAAAAGVTLETFGLEVNAPLASASQPRAGLALAADARALPFAAHSVDIVTCSQVLHHFGDDDTRQLIAEMHRVARLRVVVSEIRRAWGAAAGVWLAGWMLGFHPVSRHDGVVSVLRGFRVRELEAAVSAVTGRGVDVRNRAGFRVTASWNPA